MCTKCVRTFWLFPLQQVRYGFRQFALHVRQYVGIYVESYANRFQRPISVPSRPLNPSDVYGFVYEHFGNTVK